MCRAELGLVKPVSVAGRIPREAGHRFAWGALGGVTSGCCDNP